MTEILNQQTNAQEVTAQIDALSKEICLSDMGNIETKHFKYNKIILTERPETRKITKTVGQLKFNLKLEKISDYEYKTFLSIKTNPDYAKFKFIVENFENEHGTILIKLVNTDSYYTVNQEHEIGTVELLNQGEDEIEYIDNFFLSILMVPGGVKRHLKQAYVSMHKDLGDYLHNFDE
jgi:predicted unusual protein kinase regulating ubiquinone biosynthesis (AarF/ABC1/UbiB family)